MKSFYQKLVKPLAFQLDAENAHHLTMKLFALGNTLSLNSLNFYHRLTKEERIKLKRVVFGLEFKNPIGLAAGFDKDGKYFDLLEKLGFGFIEIGTVTPRPQSGNPKPRLFRLPADEALINRMGFNNDGVDTLVNRLKNRGKSEVILGGNIGKNKDTPNDQALDDYLICFEKLYPYVDYFVVNVSSPNTPGLRELQEKGPLTALLQGLLRRRGEESQEKPVLLKIAPDLTLEQLNDIISIVKEVNLDGLIVNNTTIDRENLKTSPQKLQSIGNGGLSGKPLKARSNELIQEIYSNPDCDFPLIGVGGIAHPKDAAERLDAGASLVQIYSGMIYYGPTLIQDTISYLLKK